jgi:hypothetical protein
MFQFSIALSFGKRSSKPPCQFLKLLGHSIGTKKMDWSTYFIYDGHSADGSNSQRWICKTCSLAVKISASSYFNALRHYNSKHNGIPEKVETGTRSSESFFQTSERVIMRRQEKQPAFDKAVLNLLAKDGVPFSLPDRENFRKIVSILDNNIQVKSRRTYVRNIGKNVFDEVVYYKFPLAAL